LDTLDILIICLVLIVAGFHGIHEDYPLEKLKSRVFVIVTNHYRVGLLRMGREWKKVVTKGKKLTATADNITNCVVNFEATCRRRRRKNRRFLLSTLKVH
jgi:hypothetical protein